MSYPSQTPTLLVSPSSCPPPSAITAQPPALPPRPVDPAAGVEWVRRIERFCLRACGSFYDLYEPGRDRNEEGVRCVWFPLATRPRDDDEVRRRSEAAKSLHLTLVSLSEHIARQLAKSDSWEELDEEVETAIAHLEAELAIVDAWMEQIEVSGRSSPDSPGQDRYAPSYPVPSAWATRPPPVEPLRARWSEDVKICREMVVGIVQEARLQAEDEVTAMDGLTPSQMGLHAFIQYSSPTGTFPQLDMDEEVVDERVGLANVLAAAQDVLDGRDRGSVGVLK